ncbi:MAG: hypothetical protein EG825_06110 [Rhodocyclaceae bacterium]|nr:hypothetical protein [Rhodocyclaceae bacterium]
MPSVSLLGHDALSRAVLAATAIYIFVLPLSGTTAMRSLAFAVLVVLTLVAMARRRLSHGLPLALPWLAYALVSMASLIYAADADYSFGEIKAEVGYGLLIFAVTIAWVRREAEVATIAWLLAAGNLAFAVGSLFNLATAGFNNSGVGAWNTGVGATSTVIISAVPWLVALAARSYGRGLRALAAGFSLLVVANLGVLFLTMNRQSWLALGVSSLVGLICLGRGFWSPKRFALVAGAGLLFVALVATQLSIRHQSMAAPLVENANTSAVQRDVRWDLWRFSVERIVEQPISGGGFGRASFNLLYRDYHLSTGSPLWHAHNMVINKGIQMGIPGILAFLALWVAMAHAARRVLCTRPDLKAWAIACLAMLAGVFVRNMTDDFFIRDHALMFWLLCGALLGAAREPATREVK